MGFHSLVARAPDLDAVFASNDQMALGALQAARHLGLEIPQDLAVVGFDDIPEASYFHPALTTIRQPIYDIGKMLSQMLIEIIKGEELAERQIILQPELVIRESSGVG